eukprot:TRINITY_DN1709_c0_g1_i2.p1 TRINITY_DN1709_c0_g1~~TRINITY_DN1709_c0_g1_i2.p1  ORF type:complete len:220 (-),score=50.73 TRINITY_DN1709_c0_g1_i2:30-689(-)
MKGIQAVIFDCDGVLVDSEPFSCGALRDAYLQLYNVDMGTNYESVLGKSMKDVIRLLGEKHDTPYDDEAIGAITEVKEKLYFESSAGKMGTFKGINELIDAGRQMKLGLAVGSSGTPEKIQFNLEQGNLSGKFDHVVSASEVARGKPHPDLFQEAAKRLNATSEKCIVIEDSTAGVKAAKAMGAYAVGLLGTFPREQLEAEGADLIISDFTELDLRKFA